MTTLLMAMLALAAQQPAAQAAPATPAAQVQPAAAAPAVAEPAAEAEPYTYDPQGRRDPFVSLVGRGSEPLPSERAAGVPGLLVSEVTVKGIIRDRQGFLAMIQAPDSKTYLVRSGDKLLDGGVKTITPEGVVFAQDVNDPLAVVKQREVPKRVRAAERD
jgi:type IV pilus assembly protein PilP